MVDTRIETRKSQIISGYQISKGRGDHHKLAEIYLYILSDKWGSQSEVEKDIENDKDISHDLGDVS